MKKITFFNEHIINKCLVSKTKLFYLLLLICSFSFAQFPTTNLIAQYGFDNGSLVDGANGANFSQHGSASLFVNDRFGTANGALQLNGDDFQRVNLDHDSSYDDISLSFWIKTATNDNNERTIIYDLGGTFNKGYHIYLKDGEINHYSRFNVGSNYIVYNITSMDISDDQWHHIAITTHMLISKIYVDGQLVDSTGNPSASSYSNRGFDSNGIVGLARNRSSYPTATSSYRDVIDDILIYDREISAAEITSIGDYNFCVGITNQLFTSNITATNIDVNVPGTQTVDIAYHEVSQPFSSATVVSSVSGGASTTITGTSPETYKVYVRKDCGNGSYSSWSAPLIFKNTGIPTYVNYNATGNNDGSSWSDAYINLNTALDLANSGDHIWVASGNYKPHAFDRSVYFTVNKENLKIIGGFNGTETQESDADHVLNTTILSGDLQDNDVNITDFISSYSNTTRNADNSYHVINITEYGNNLLLEGITVSDAHNNLDAFESGGAIVKDSGVTKLTLKNCIIKDNVSRNGNAGLLAEYDLNGTGILGELNIENCIFSNNMARWATAIYSFVRDDTDANINITNSLFDGNIAGNLNSTTAQGYAGSSAWLRNLSISSSSTLNIDIINSTFVSNSDTGTEQNLNNFSRSTLAISRSNGNAGAVNTTVANSIFWGNTATGGLTARSITDLYEQPPTSVNVLNSIDEANFNDAVITNTSNTTNSNPLFTDAANGDFTLSSGSPAVDTGDNSFVFESTDLLGNQRVFNTTVDMGVYEFGAPFLSTNDFQLNENEIKLYPNPTNSILNIEMTQNIKQASVYSILGKEVIRAENKQIDVSRLPNGVFLIKIEDVNGNVSTKRFIKE